jgi:cyclic pyranopterin phosphate synthase
MTRLPLVDHATYDRALRMASAARAGAVPAGDDAAGAGALVDRFGRRITYLRLSVTDRCNLRCEYCAPVDLGLYAPKADILLDDEIVEILSRMARLGLEKVRFTGGEPLVRPGFLELVRRVRAIEGLRELCLSTNGILLEEQAESLLAAGITRVNVSLDTLDAARFRAVTRGGDLARVLRGVERLLALGAPLVKLNVVLMRGVNDGEIEDFARLTLERPLAVRFIELMPLAHCGEIYDDRYVPADFVLATLTRMGWRPEPLARGANDGPALAYRLPGARGSVGVISPVSETHFCDRCNRVRLSADGLLKLCLFGDEYVDLRAVLRGERRPGDVEDALARAMALKPEKMAGFAGFTMMAIGG